MKKPSKPIKVASPPGSEALPAVVRLNLLTRCEGLGMQANLTSCLDNFRFCCESGIRRSYQRNVIQKCKHSPPGCRSLKGK